MTISQNELNTLRGRKEKMAKVEHASRGFERERPEKRDPKDVKPDRHGDRSADTRDN
jgi:hypothetical protein